MTLVELYAVPDVYCTGLGAVEILPGGSARFTLYVEKMGPDGTALNVVVENIVMPLSMVPDAILKASAATAVGLVSTVKAMLPAH